MISVHWWAAVVHWSSCPHCIHLNLGVMAVFHTNTSPHQPLTLCKWLYVQRVCHLLSFSCVGFICRYLSFLILLLI